MCRLFIDFGELCAKGKVIMFQILVTIKSFGSLYESSLYVREMTLSSFNEEMYLFFSLILTIFRDRSTLSISENYINPNKV